jgi:hypothetical protein
VVFRWLTVFLDFPADRFGAGAAFWQRVTGYGLSPSRGADGEFATLALGASVTAALEYWTVLADPAARAYCLVNRNPA